MKAVASALKPVMRRTYTVAFNRDRDSYQLPLALHQAGLLANLVTDYYASDTDLRKHLTPTRFKHRYVAGLPSTRVTSCFKALAFQSYYELFRHWGGDLYMTVDIALSKAAANVAAKNRSDLLLYSHYALEAFTDNRLAGRKKGLFVFHPHHSLITEILADDREHYPETKSSVWNEREIVNQRLKDRIDAECDLADFLLCASSFTRRSLIHHGVDASRVLVVPYGTSARTTPPRPRAESAAARFLFVGQGVQRKGLHHLLRAWRDARLTRSSLRLVCSRLDPEFISLTDQPNVQVSSAISETELHELFSSSHIFVMPSLVEGFGLVYLEALAAGCFLISTANTGVPDLDLPDSMAAQVNVGDIAQLTNALQMAERLHSNKMIDHAAIRQRAESLSWETFRLRIIESLKQLCE